MDYGELFKSEFEILPAEEGGFIVTLGANYTRSVHGVENNIRDAAGRPRQRWAFSNVTRLMDWLSEHARRFAAPKTGNQT